MLRKILFSILFVGSILTSVSSQTKLKKLPSNINRPSINLYAPFVSGDGQTLVFLSDYSEEGHHSMRWTTKKTVSTWNDYEDVNKLINRPTLNFRGGYCLSFDGDMLYFTSLKSGLGGFDIWSSRRRGNDWEAPKNMGLPINSRTNEGSPMLSPDGEYLYFMRCEKMKQYGGASGCTLMYSKKKYNGWSDPIELPANINTGNSQTPRLLADGETLIFSSDQMGGQGGLDLFMAKKVGENEWSDPVPMTFANTPEEDAFVSIPAKGRYMYRSIKGDREYELVEELIPEEFQPKSVMRVQGLITNETGEPVNADLTIFDINNRDRLWNEKVGKAGEFAIVLKEGSNYDLSVDNGDPTYMYYSKLYALEEEIGPRDKEKLKIELVPLKSGNEYPIDILFKPYGDEVRDISTYELRRLGDFIRKNENMKVELGVYQTSYQEDSIQSHPDLTEIRIDTVLLEKPYVEAALVPYKYDSLFKQITASATNDLEVTIDSMTYQVKQSEDSLYIEGVKIIAENQAPDALTTDATASDTVRLASSPPKSAADTLKLSYPLVKFETKQVFHNDRTEAQSKAIETFLLDRGVKPEQLRVKGYRKSNPLPGEGEEQQTVKVKMKVLSF